MGFLYIIATPIGNLNDITLRAINVLKDSDLVLAEDTRITRKLLSYYKISKPVQRCDEHSFSRVKNEIKERLKKGQKIALVTDAGTPGISDPGSEAVKFVLEKVPSAKIIPIPGASALTAALSISGLRANQFVFLGYPPALKKRRKFFEELKNTKIRPIILYESPHRIEKTLIDLLQVLEEEKEIIIARELTKIYEEIFRGKLKEAVLYFKGERKRGEFTLVIP